jgi:hypothetical protein
MWEVMGNAADDEGLASGPDVLAVRQGSNGTVGRWFGVDDHGDGLFQVDGTARIVYGVIQRTEEGRVIVDGPREIAQGIHVDGP